MLYSLLLMFLDAATDDKVQSLRNGRLRSARARSATSRIQAVKVKLKLTESIVYVTILTCLCANNERLRVFHNIILLCKSSGFNQWL